MKAYSVYMWNSCILKIKRSKRVVHLWWAVVANVEVFVFKIGTMGQSTAHLVGPVPTNLLTADTISNHIPGYLLMSVVDWAWPVWSVRLCHRSLIRHRRASFSPHCTRFGWHHSSCSCCWTCTGSPHSCWLQSRRAITEECHLFSLVFWAINPIWNGTCGLETF